MKNTILILIIILFGGCYTNTSFQQLSDNEIVDYNSYDSLVLLLNSNAMHILDNYKRGKYGSASEHNLLESLNLIDSAISIDDTYPRLYSNKMQILFHLNQSDSAMKLFTFATKKDSNNPYLYFSLGAILAKKGNYHDAVRAFQKSNTLFENTHYSTIIFDIKSKEISFLFGYGKQKAEQRIDSIIKIDNNIFYDRALKEYIKSMEMNEFVKNW